MFKPLKARLKLKSRRCPYCGARFVPIRRHQRFDSPSCRSLHWQLLHPKANEHHPALCLELYRPP